MSNFYTKHMVVVQVVTELHCVSLLLVTFHIFAGWGGGNHILISGIRRGVSIVPSKDFKTKTKTIIIEILNGKFSYNQILRFYLK